MKSPKYLSKSRFKTAYECPTKLFYLDRPEYGNNNKENAFLEALAQGGFQVGALAKLMYPGGVDLEGMNSADAILKTNELLKNDKVTIFEAAIQTGSFLVRVDVLKKSGNHVELIEVKAKSYDFDGEGFFLKRGKGISSTWEPYLVDVAFQTFVANLAHPEWVVDPYLMLVNKTKVASVDGLHQRFLLANENGRNRVVIRDGTSKESLGLPLLQTVGVKAEIEYLINEDLFQGMSFIDYANYLASHLDANKKPDVRLGAYCKGCEFRIGSESKLKGLVSGFESCWIEKQKLKTEDFLRPMVFDLWNSRQTPKFLSEDIIFLDELSEEDIVTKSKSNDNEGGLSTQERQWLQVEKVKKKDSTAYIDLEGLKSIFKGFKYPLHFIDFETTMVAIPFHAGRRPYEQLAFQFSHHTLAKDGTVTHADQYLYSEVGGFPNFDFVRALKKSLSADNGTIFRYAAHENNVLKQIADQIRVTPPQDADELLTWIEDVTSPNKEDQKAGSKPGKRAMIDLLDIVKKYFYHPRMAGSNSIKKVIPAVLEESLFLKDKYSKTIYGAAGGIQSLNFKNWAWLKLDEKGKVKDPYKLLPKVFDDVDDEFFEEGSTVSSLDVLNDGGAAMTAYARMQFTEMSDAERLKIREALLKYCELDTLSMVMLIEYFLHISAINILNK